MFSLTVSKSVAGTTATVQNRHSSSNNDQLSLNTLSNITEINKHEYKYREVNSKHYKI